MTNPVYDKLRNCYDSIKGKIPFEPKVALVLGSGLGDYAEQLEIQGTIDYHDIEGFPVSTVPGHKGRFVFARINEVPAVLMQGRVHYYEGYPMSDVVLPVRLMKLMGAEILFLTNAAGGVNYDYGAGVLYAHKGPDILLCPLPAGGAELEELGPRFPDMSHIYDEDLRDIIRSTALELGIRIQEGVYVQLTGPAYESPHEVKMCRILGGDAVGMSTACEAVAANHMGMKICGISCISNLACGMTDVPLSHKEVQEASDKMAPLFKKLVSESIRKLGSI